MACHPDVVHPFCVVDGGVDVAGDVDDIQGQPTGSVNNHHNYHHPNYL
jgi:hypothetical protein